MKRMLLMIAIAAVCLGGYYFSTKGTVAKMPAAFGKSSVPALEMRITADQLMESHKKDLLKTEQYSFLTPKLVFVPHLLMEVKFTAENSSTGEGKLLWSLTDGEMVLSTTSWEKTHGYEDCLKAKVSREEFAMIDLIARSKGAIVVEKLGSSGKMLDKIVAKKLIAISGPTARLHFKDPKFAKLPMTAFEEGVVSFPTHGAKKFEKLYSESEVTKFMSIVFGDDFAIRSSKLVYLPIHVLTVQNPDGSTLTTYWNSLNGSEVHLK